MIKSNRRHTLFAHNKHRKKENNTIDFDDFFKKATILPNKQKQQQDEQNEQHQPGDTVEEVVNIEPTQMEITTKIPMVNTSEILKGVVACIDVRTEDGDDVSHNFESAIQSMGGETRKIFSDTVTHFVFKNGSNATLRKAMTKGIYVINLLWISRCRMEGRRLDEKDFLYEQPLGLILTEKRRRPKSMKPRKIKGLTDNMDEDEDEMDDKILSEALPYTTPEQRYIFDLTEYKNKLDTEKRAHKRQRTQEELVPLEEEHIEENKEKEKKKDELVPVLSAENIADRRNKKTEEKTDKMNKLIIPCADESVKNQIKASFSIGQQNDIHSDSHVNLPNSLAMSKAPLKRKRKLTNIPITSSPSLSIMNIPPRQVVNYNTQSKETIKIDDETPTIKPTTTTSTSTLSTLTRQLSISPPEPIPSPSMFSISPQVSPKKKPIESNPTIVFTNLSPKARQRCMAVVNRLGKYEIVSEVDERTTHVVAGKQRRTESVVLGLLRGAYIVKPEWLYDVEDENSYTPVHYYELSNWLTTSVHRRSTPLFSSSTHIWVKSALSGINLIETFVRLAGGTVVSSQEEADIIISEEPLSHCRKPVVSELWVYESIDAWKSLPVKGYFVE